MLCKSVLLNQYGVVFCSFDSHSLSSVIVCSESIQAYASLGLETILHVESRRTHNISKLNNKRSFKLTHEIQKQVECSLHVFKRFSMLTDLFWTYFRRKPPSNFSRSKHSRKLIPTPHCELNGSSRIRSLRFSNTT